MKQLSELTGLYSLSKTLRFELKPIGKTLEHIESKGLIAQDEQRAEEYKKVKDIIDRYHKKFITMCLSDFKFEQNSLETYVALAEDTNRDEKVFDEIKKTLRKQIVETFKKGGSYSDLFKKELIQKHLPEFVSDEEEKKMIANFSKFTTYFNGFNENRKNMYSDEDKSTAIAYRLIHENLPMFVNNMKSFSRIADSDVHQHFTEIESSFSEYLGVEHLEEMFQLDYFSETLTQEQIAVYNHIIGGRALEDGTKLKGINEYVNLYNQQHKDSRLPLLKPLYKMILSDRVALPWFPSEEFASDEEMIRAINETYNTLKEVLSIDGDSSLRSLLLNISSYDIKHIYIANDLGQFEKMLIDKLNYYVDKQKNSDEAGGLLHALQLTSKFESFKKLGKQSGCLFYIPAWNTSKIDPVTGFVNLFDTRYTNADQARKFFSQFDSIRYNAYKDWFEFAFDYNKFTAKAKDTRTKWTLCTYGTRIRTFRNPARLNQWDNEEVVLTDEFKKAFANADINIHGNLKEAICSLQDKKYLEPLMHLMKLLLQMRNSITNSEVDYLLSPVADENGTFYDSRICSASLPKDADANGAYNIARKGLWAIHQIQETPAGDRPNLAIKNKDWLNFAQQKPYMNE